MRSAIAKEAGQRSAWADRLLEGQLEGEDLDELLRVGRALRRPGRSRLLTAEQDRVLLLLSGTVKEHLTGGDGHEVITAIHGAGHAGGLLVALGHPGPGTELTSLEPVDALAVEGPDLRRLVADRPSIAAACLRTVASQHAAASAERARFAGTCVSQRVAERLLELVTRWGRADGPAVRITLPLTQEELGAWSGASRESVAKVLNGMRTNGMLLTGRRSLTVLDLDRLRQRCARSGRVPAVAGIMR